MGDEAQMILMMDHITTATSVEKRREVLEQFCGYTVRFSESGLPNVPAKQLLFQRPHKDHELIKLDHPAGYPVEIVVYDSCYGSSGIVIDQSVKEIRISTRNMDRSVLFWRTLGFHPIAGDATLLAEKSVLDKAMVKIRLVGNLDEGDAFLDRYGPVAVAFVVTRQSEMLKELAEKVFFTSETDRLLVNGKELDIAFAASGYGDIAELISIPGPKGQIIRQGTRGKSGQQ